MAERIKSERFTRGERKGKGKDRRRRINSVKKRRLERRGKER